MKQLVKSISDKTNEKLKCEIYNIDNQYFTIVLNNKTEYMTNNFNNAFIIAKISVVYYSYISRLNKILYSKGNNEEKWFKIVALLSKLYNEDKKIKNKARIGRIMALSILETIELAFDEIYKVKNKEELKIVYYLNNIRFRDNFYSVLYDIGSFYEPKIAAKNYNKYIKSRNNFIKNKNIKLDLIKEVNITEFEKATA